MDKLLVGVGVCGNELNPIVKHINIGIFFGMAVLFIISLFALLLTEKQKVGKVFNILTIISVIVFIVWEIIFDVICVVCDVEVFISEDGFCYVKKWCDRIALISRLTLIISSIVLIIKWFKVIKAKKHGENAKVSKKVKVAFFASMILLVLSRIVFLVTNYLEFR